MHRRDFLASTVAAVAFPLYPSSSATAPKEREAAIYGLIGKMTATSGQRDALAAIVLEGTGSMPGCLSYIVATDPADPNALWITEAWESQAAHEASLRLPAVQIAITKGRSLIAGFGAEPRLLDIG